MDASIIQLSWSITAICGFALAAFLVTICLSVYRGYKQRLSVGESIAARRRAQDSELAITLQHTLSDLAIRDRDVRWHTVRVARIVQESEDVKSFYLLDMRSDSLPEFLPGQHLLVERPRRVILASGSDSGRASTLSDYGDGADNGVSSRPGDSQIPKAFTANAYNSESDSSLIENGSRSKQQKIVTEPTYRCYSLSDDCQEGYWRITVKRTSNLETSISRWLHEDIHEGDTLRVRGPLGAFYLGSCTARNVVFLSAGVGITPLIPMVFQAARRPHGSIHFMAQFRDAGHAPLAEQLLALAKAQPDHRIQLWFSALEQIPNGKPSRIIQHGRFTSADVCRELEVPEETDVYLCGPETWIRGMRHDLIAEGILESNIHFELFHSAGHAASNAIEALPDSLTPYTDRNKLSITRSKGRPSVSGSMPKASVHFRSSDCLTEFTSDIPNLLTLASKNNVAIDSGCRTGACGSCAVKLLQGKVRYTRKPQCDVKPSEILPCVCVPDGDIVVEA